ncbi:hypothetical protein J1605_003414 [Eschrichtius robustus]|uniref:Uncharacterized protein n=1 Tax=Eschrichtius robustus TaxID=9764 RepID=A0AB34HRC0_ESCRO|nr:hypothetical protein J1605_003414 [Eschrichtius robustus]
MGSLPHGDGTDTEGAEGVTHCRCLRTHRYPPSAQQEGPPPPPTGKASPGQDVCPCGVRTPPQDHLRSPGTPPPPTGPRAHVPATPLCCILLRHGQAIGVTPPGWLVAGAWRLDGAAVGLTVHRQLVRSDGAAATDGAGPSCPDTRFGPRTQESKLTDQVPVGAQGSGGSGRTPCGAVAAPRPAAGRLLGPAGLRPGQGATCRRTWLTARGRRAADSRTRTPRGEKSVLGTPGRDLGAWSNPASLQPRGPEEPRRLPEPTPEAGKHGGGGSSWCRRAWTQSAGPKGVGPDLTPCQGASIPGD